MQLVDGGTMIDFDYIGEGLSGDYDADDPNDVPLLRFYIFKKVYSNPDLDSTFIWEQHSSYCTQVSADVDIKTEAKLLGIIMETIKYTNFNKVELEKLSHMDESWASG